MSQAVARLHAQGRITSEQALDRSSHPDELRDLLARNPPGPDDRPESRRRPRAGAVR